MLIVFISVGEPEQVKKILGARAEAVKPIEREPDMVKLHKKPCSREPGLFRG